MADRAAITEQIQRKVAHLVATLPVGVGLCLIGGFRYRLLARHAAAIDAIILGQIEPASAATLADAGGGKAVLESVRELLADLLTDFLAAPERRP